MGSHGCCLDKNIKNPLTFVALRAAVSLFAMPLGEQAHRSAYRPNLHSCGVQTPSAINLKNNFHFL